MNTSNKYRVCKNYVGRKVMIKTTQGTYQGTIVKVDKNRVYLKTTRNKNKAQVSFIPFILPLVLFDLLVIILLDTKPRPYF
ncbi:hypothetical protein [Paenibacillus sp. Soil787]|uniref:hypothetical protein n=1 Tax=Paenibacillus sp. Soil787 TaxID=1736411 RepID=UPI0006F1E2A2|nr:hypothetical protein [Paenibacillus sp. Soil787]KRF42332.1 hypothetical protein ASG93_21840 [Paenibacillus sp. Soil787]